MRGILGLFLEVTAAKGEWAAALSAVQAAGIPLLAAEPLSIAASSASAPPPPPPREPLTGAHVQLLVNLFLREGHPALATAVAALPPPYVSVSSTTGDAVGTEGVGERSDVACFVAAQQSVMRSNFDRGPGATDHPQPTDAPRVCGWMLALLLVQRSTCALCATHAKSPRALAEDAAVREYCQSSASRLRALLPESEREAHLATLTSQWKALAAARCSAMRNEAAGSEAAGRGPEEREPVSAMSSTSGRVSSTDRVPPPLEKRPRQRKSGTKAGGPEQGLMKRLHALHKGPKARETWSAALVIATQQLPCMTPDAFCLVVAILARHGREQEVLALTKAVLLTHHKAVPRLVEQEEGEGKGAGHRHWQRTSFALVPSPRLLKAVAEAAHTLQSELLATLALSTPRLAGALTPSSAVPLILTLQRRRRQDVVLEWWRCLPPAAAQDGDAIGARRVNTTENAGGSHVGSCTPFALHQPVEEARETVMPFSHDGDDGRRQCTLPATVVPMQRHLKLCNYIAVCYLTYTREQQQWQRRQRMSALAKESSPVDCADWATALSFLTHAKDRDPALATLFSLRLLRVARAWEAALRLLHTELLEPFAEDTGSVRCSPRSRASSDGGCVSADRRQGKGDATRPADASEADEKRRRREQWMRSGRAAADVLRLFTRENPQQWIPQCHHRRIEQLVTQVVQQHIIGSGSGDRHHRRRPPAPARKTGRRGDNTAAEEFALLRKETRAHHTCPSSAVTGSGK